MCKVISPVLLKAVTENATALAQDTFGTQFISEVLISGQGLISRTCFPSALFVVYIVANKRYVTGDKTAALEAVAALAAPTATDSDDAASTTLTPSLYRLLKVLVQNGFFNTREKKLEGMFSSLSLLYQPC